MILSLDNTALALKTKENTLHLHVSDYILLSPENTRIDWAGEYDISGISFQVFEDQRQQRRSFFFVAEKVRYFSPSADSSQIANEVLAETGGIDVLLADVGILSWEKKEWKKFLEEHEPQVVVLSGPKEQRDTIYAEVSAEPEDISESTEILQKTLPADKTRYISMV